MQERMNQSEIEDRVLKRLAEYTEDRKQQHQLLTSQESEFAEYREKTRNEQLMRERKMQKELEAREKFFSDREQKLLQRQHDLENQFIQRQQEIQVIKAEVTQRESELQQANLELQHEKDRYNKENRERLERTSKNYVEKALGSLQLQETKFHKSSENWSSIGAGALIVGLVFFACVTLSSLSTLPSVVTWELIVFSLAKGLIALTLLGALARYAFLLSNSYVREALKNADRRHAINFGNFYLESYGAAADWSQVKEAFEHWNINGANSFSQSEEKLIDAESTGKAVTLIEQFSKFLSKPKAGEGS